MIEGWLPSPLGYVTTPGSGDGYRFRLFLAIGGDRYRDRRFGETRLNKLICREIAETGKQRLHASGVHLLSIRPPIRTALGQVLSLRTVVDFDFGRLVVTKVKEFFVAELVQALGQFFAEIGEISRILF